MIMNIPTAADARQQIQLAETAEVSALIAQIEESIISAITAGRCRVSVNGAKFDSILQDLSDKGYLVSYVYDQRDGDFYDISW
jgi:hypothetical protein